ncbi:MAG TPA: hypothetical protein VKB12_18070 [Pyrinomonadaceae bacterium]|nr:hypothetical protein [Pyrinomonadaceae bacterium]
MKRLALAFTLASLAAFHADDSGARPAPDCPVVTVSCADTIRGGEQATFAATVSGADPSATHAFNWTVSAGAIASGQGTSSIVVDTDGLPSNSALTATVDVKGLPESCPASDSCTAGVVTAIVEDRIDEYGDIRFEDEMARLDNFAIELQNWPQGVGYIIAYGGRVGRRGEALKRAGRAKRYMTTVRGIPSEQVVIIDGGYHEDLTLVLKLRGRDLPPPTASPTVDPKDVRFIKDRSKAGARRGTKRSVSAAARTRARS